MRKLTAAIVSTILVLASANQARANDNAVLGLVIGGTLGLIIGNEIGRDHREYRDSPQIYMISPPPPPRVVYSTRYCQMVAVGYDYHNRPIYRQECW